MIFLISSESETDILQRLYFPMVRRRGSGSRPLMPLQGVPHQRLEVGDARGKSHHHPFGPFIISSPQTATEYSMGSSSACHRLAAILLKAVHTLASGGGTFFTSIAADPSGGGAKEKNSVLWIGHRSDHHLPFKPVQFFQRRNKEPKRDSKDHTSEASIVSWFVHQASMQQSPRCSGMSSHTRQHVSAFSSLHDPMMTG